MTFEEILERSRKLAKISKLLALSRDKGATPAERDSAWSAAKKLALKNADLRDWFLSLLEPKPKRKGQNLMAVKLATSNDNPHMTVIILPGHIGHSPSASVPPLKVRTHQCRDSLEAEKMLAWLDANGIPATRTTPAILARWLEQEVNRKEFLPHD